MTKQNIRVSQIVLMLLSFLMIFSSTFVSSATVDANDSDISLCYVNIDYTTVTLTFSGIKAECYATMNTDKSIALKIKMELQKKKSSGYETVKTWTSSKTGTFISMSESRNINILCDYRLKVTFTAGSETTVVYKY